MRHKKCVSRSDHGCAISHQLTKFHTLHIYETMQCNTWRPKLPAWKEITVLNTREHATRQKCACSWKYSCNNVPTYSVKLLMQCLQNTNSAFHVWSPKFGVNFLNTCRLSWIGRAWQILCYMWITYYQGSSLCTKISNKCMKFNYFGMTCAESIFEIIPCLSVQKAILWLSTCCHLVQQGVQMWMYVICSCQSS